MFHLVTHSYCGMSCPHVSTEDRTWARDQTAALLRKRRRAGFRVILGSRTEDYRSYEVLEPEECRMVPDECGIIALRRELFECGECGSEYDQQEAARQCCAEHDYQYSHCGHTWVDFGNGCDSECPECGAPIEAEFRE